MYRLVVRASGRVGRLLLFGRFSSFLVFSRLFTLVIFELPVFYCHLDNGIATYETFSPLVS